MNKSYDVCVIGGGASGMSAALGAIHNGAKRVLIIERGQELGGILNQCIHNGFGLHHYHEELTGPAYAERLMSELKATHVEIKVSTTVLKITKEKKVHYMNEKEGYQILEANAIVLATGCRERTRYQIDLPGKRLAGIMTAGLAQRYLNIDGYLVGKRVFILGSGDIGLIMARRMTLEGAKVLGVAEIMPYSNGLNRNIVQCLHDYNIPLYLGYTVVDVNGNERLEGITIAKVDHTYQPIEGTEKHFDLDTLLLSIGLIPENQLLKEIHTSINPLTQGAIVDNYYQTSINGIFACGNALHVHDLVDDASLEGFIAGKYAACYQNHIENHRKIIVKNGKKVRYVVPNIIQIAQDENEITLKFRVIKPIEKGKIIVKLGKKIIKEIKRTHLLPAEMEQIHLKTRELNQLIEDELTIDVLGGD